MMCNLSKIKEESQKIYYQFSQQLMDNLKVEITESEKQRILGEILQKMFDKNLIINEYTKIKIKDSIFNYINTSSVRDISVLEKIINKVGNFREIFYYHPLISFIDNHVLSVRASALTYDNKGLNNYLLYKLNYNEIYFNSSLIDKYLAKFKVSKNPDYFFVVSINKNLDLYNLIIIKILINAGVIKGVFNNDNEYFFVCEMKNHNQIVNDNSFESLLNFYREGKHIYNFETLSTILINLLTIKNSCLTYETIFEYESIEERFFKNKSKKYDVLFVIYSLVHLNQGLLFKQRFLSDLSRWPAYGFFIKNLNRNLDKSQFTHYFGKLIDEIDDIILPDIKATFQSINEFRLDANDLIQEVDYGYFTNYINLLLSFLSYHIATEIDEKWLKSQLRKYKKGITVKLHLTYLKINGYRMHLEPPKKGKKSSRSFSDFMEDMTDCPNVLAQQLYQKFKEEFDDSDKTYVVTNYSVDEMYEQYENYFYKKFNVSTVKKFIHEYLLMYNLQPLLKRLLRTSCK